MRSLYAGGRWGWVLFIGGAEGAGGDAMCVTLYAGGAGGDALCALEAGGCGRWALFAGGVGGAGGDAMCATPYAGGAVGDAPCALCMLEVVESGLCLLDVLEVLRVPDVMRRVLLCMLEVYRT